MKLANGFKQGSSEWFAWRGTGLGASDAPIVMGASPWTTRFELWAQKRKILQAAQPEYNQMKAMVRGTLLEEKARALYSKQAGVELTTPSVEHPEYPFIRASLDGWSDISKVIVEIKSPGKADLAEAAKGRIPRKYQPQLAQQLMLVPGASHIDYVTYDGEDKIYVTQFKRDVEYEAKLLQELIAFWRLVEDGVPPAVTTDELDKMTARLNKEMERVNGTVRAITIINECLIQRG